MRYFRDVPEGAVGAHLEAVDALGRTTVAGLAPRNAELRTCLTEHFSPASGVNGKDQGAWDDYDTILANICATGISAGACSK